MKTNQMKKVWITALATISASAMAIPSTMPLFAQENQTELSSKESLKELEIKKNQIEKELQSISGQVDHKKAEIASAIQNKENALSAEISKLNQEINAKQSELDQKSETLTNTESDLEKAKEDLESKKSELSDTQTKLKDYGTLDSLNSELAIAKDEHTQAISDFVAAQGPLNETEKAYYSAVEETKSATEKTKTAQSNYDVANERYTEANSKFIAAQEKYNTCSEDEKSDAIIELDYWRSTYYYAKGDLEDAESILNQRKEEQSKAEAAQKNAYDEYDKAAADFRKASNDLTDAINKEKELESRINNYDTDYYNSLSKQCESLNKEIPELEDEIEVFNTKIKTLNQEIEELSEDLTQLKQNVKDKEEKLAIISSYKDILDQVLKEGTKVDLSAVKDENLKAKLQELASLIEQKKDLNHKFEQAKIAYEKEKKKKASDVQTSFETNLISSAAAFGLAGLALVEIKRRKENK